MIRWQFTRNGRFKVPARVEIHDDEYSGSPQELDLVGSDPVKKTGGQRNSNVLRRIFGEYLEIRLRGKTGDFEDFFKRDNTRFRVKLFVDGEFDSEYIPITDTHREPDTKGTFEITLRCAGISALKQVKAWKIFGITGTDDRRAGDAKYSVLDGIHKIITHFYDLTVTDGTRIYPTANTSTSALSQYFFSTKRFNSEQTAYEALEWLIGENNQIRIQDGTAYVFCPLDAEFTGYEYNGSSISSGQTFDSNFIAEKVGGRLSTTRSNQQAYDGVRRIYRPGEAPNLVPGGNMADLDDFVITPSAPFTPRFGFPIGWNLIQSGLFDATRVVSSDDYRNPLAWRLRTGFVRIAGTNQYSPSIFQAETGTSIQQGKRVRVGLTYRFDADRRNTYGVPVEVRVGDYVLVRQLTGSTLNPEPGELEWVLRSSVSFPQNFLLPTAEPGITEDFSVISPPLPVTGEVSFLVASPLPSVMWVAQILGRFGSLPVSGTSIDDYVDISQISCDVTDEEGEIIIESKELAGEDGDVYEFVDYFGDGFTSVTPGALELSNGNPTTLWRIPGLTGEFTLAEIKTKFILSEFSRDRKRLQGRIDVYDAIALVNDFRMNYYSVSYVWGHNDVELCEISEHDLEATTEERRERGTGSFTGRPSIDPPPLNFFGNLLRIGELNEDVDEERTEIDVIVDEPIRAGYEYWIINESELDPRDKEAGVYPFLPRFLNEQGEPIVISDPLDLPEGTQSEFGSGDIDLIIEEVLITAPLGSIIVEAPGQREIERNITDERVKEGEERIRELNEEKIPELEGKLDDLDDKLDDLDDEIENLNTVVLPELNNRLDDLDDEIENLNDTVLPALDNRLSDAEDDISNLENTVIPALDGKIDDLDDILGNPPDSATFFESIVTNQAWIDELVASQAWIDNLFTNNVFANRITASDIVAGTITSNEINVNNLAANTTFTDAIVANNGFINELVARQLFTDELAANNVFTDELVANNAFINELVARNLFVDELVANDTFTDNLIAKTAWVDALIANMIDVRDFYANDATIGATLTLDADAKIRRTVSSRDIIIGGNLTSEELNRPQALFGFSDANLPMLEVRSDNDNRVRIVGRPSSSTDPFFRITSDGDDVLLVSRDGMTIGDNFEITNPSSDFIFSDSGLVLAGSNFMSQRSVVFRQTLPSGTVMGELTTSLTGESMNLRSLNDNSLVLSSTNILTATAQNRVEIVAGPNNDFRIIGLPTSNPGGSNRVWNDGGTLKIT